MNYEPMNNKDLYNFFFSLSFANEILIVIGVLSVGFFIAAFFFLGHKKFNFDLKKLRPYIYLYCLANLVFIFVNLAAIFNLPFVIALLLALELRLLIMPKKSTPPPLPL